MFNMMFLKNIKNYLQYAVILIAIFVSISGLIYFYNKGSIVDYGDAASHLNIARRVFDSLTGGVGQIIGVWLPLQHVPMLPFIWNDFLWHSGIAGSLMSMTAFVLGAYLTFKLIYLLTKDKWASFIASLIYILNPNMIYFQTTPMTESLFIFLLIAVAYYFAKWIHKGNIIQLIGCGFYSFLLVLHRYEGWLTLLMITISVGLWALYKEKNLKKVESTLIIYLTIAGFGLVLFFGAQYLFLGSPIYFLTSPYSAKAHADEIASGLFHTMGDIPKSILTYWWAVTISGGFWFTLLTTVSLPLLILLSFIRKSFDRFFVIVILISPYIFQVLVLYLGKVPLLVPQLDPFGTVNIRYGLYSFPLVIVIIGLIINELRRLVVLRYLVILLLLTIMLVLSTKFPPSLIVHGEFGGIVKDSKLLKQFKNNYDGGLVLISSGAFDPFMYHSGLLLKTFISDGSQKYWRESLVDPAKYADWVIVSSGNHPRDFLAKAVRENSNFLYNFNLIYKDTLGSIYKKK